MYKKLVISSLLITGMANNPGYADEEAAQIRQDCETEVQSYAIVEPDDYKQAINDCIESFTPQAPAEHYQDNSQLDERT